MIPNVVPSGSGSARPAPTISLVDRLDRPVMRVERARASRARARRARGDQRVAPPTSMYSMKRTSAVDRPCRTRSASTSSSSLTPRMTTVSILRPAEDARAAASMPASTRVELVEARQRAEASRLQRVEADGDAVAGRRACSASTWSASSTPLVVSARSCKPRLARRASRPAPAGRGAAAARRRSAGPCRRRARGRRRRARSISSKCSMSSRGSQT